MRIRHETSASNANILVLMNITSRLKRRTTVAAIAAATIAALAIAIPSGTALALRGTPAASSVSTAVAVKPTIVLVHGAWADASSFAPVTLALQKAGYTVRAAPNALRGVKEDSDYLKAYLAGGVTGPVVLVGHSYGGVVISNAAVGNANVKALVYVDAYAPDENETAADLTNKLPGSLLNAPPQSVFNLFKYPDAPEEDWDSTIKPPLFKKIFAAGLTNAVSNVAGATQTPIKLSALQTPSGVPAWKTIPSYFFIGTADMVIPPAEQRVMAKRANGVVVEAKAPHLSMLAKPAEITALIIKAAKATAK